MKKFITIGLILTLAFTFTTKAQRYKGKDVALISFSVSIDEDVKAILDKYESQFPNTTNKKADKIIAIIKNQTWAAIADTLQGGVDMSVLPATTFRNKSNYDEYGYPNISISKAQQIGYSKIFIKVELEILTEQPQNTSNKSKTKNQTKPKEGELFPYVSLTITTFSVNGIIPIGKFTGTAQSQAAWGANSSSIIDGLVNADFKDDNTSLMSLVTNSIHRISKNMQAK